MKKRVAWIVLLLIVLILYYNYKPYEKAELVRVVDGDTVVVKINNKYKKVRLTLIDTKELGHGGEKARDYVKKLLKPKQIIYLEKDIGNLDRYGRLLRYLYFREEDVGNIDKSLNAKLLVNDLASIKAFFPNYKYLINLYYYTKVK